MTEQKKRGGRRVGSGRKAIYDEPMDATITLKAPKRIKDKAKRIGDQAVRDLIDAAPEPGEAGASAPAEGGAG